MTLTRRIPTKTESQTTFRSGQLSHQPPSSPKLHILKPKWRGKRSMKEENGYTEARISKGKGARGSNCPSREGLLVGVAVGAMGTRVAAGKVVVLLLSICFSRELFHVVVLSCLLRWSGACMEPTRGCQYCKGPLFLFFVSSFV
ncbi:hypothetical protein COLO4_37846 [Corchorus olitorius]|uniref:Uncharacterized protein n=1 Tax=Corchorus olitorius TaxID=93759 RepID=A0A1R3FYW3_9ROSI|nr:hypothetical protein COLO4_37846 [Corchorus olitorius]